MFPRRYFAPRYFGGRYFPESEGEAPSASAYRRPRYRTNYMYGTRRIILLLLGG